MVTTQPKSNTDYSKADSWKMFNRISGRYDALNRILSFGLDIGWRKKLAKFLPQRNNLEMLDLATGTADVPIYLLKTAPQIHSFYAIDKAEDMLKIAENKIKKEGLETEITLHEGDITDIPFDDGCFDGVTTAFGIRNVQEPLEALKEMRRVLKPRGCVLILEFSFPSNFFLRAVYLFYLRRIVPALGALISGDSQAYRYLTKTIENFPYGQEFISLMSEAGFQKTCLFPLAFGAATIYRGEKP